MEAFEHPDIEIFSRKGLQEFDDHLKKAEEEYQKELNKKQKAAKLALKSKNASDV